MNIIDRLIKKTIETKNPSVIGLDPDLRKIPDCYKKAVQLSGNPLANVSEVIYKFNCDIIDTVSELVPAVKPQMAFYEKYGSFGVAAFEKTVSYAKEKGLIVIEDAKRNDIGNTAKAYADGHIGMVEAIDGSYVSSFDVDFLTVTPFLGSESINPFVDVSKKHNKGIFILIKTSNTSSGEIQNVIAQNGMSISQNLARYVAEKSDGTEGNFNYSPIGAVVGATYPEEALMLRRIMPRNYFLVPGYGVQGGSAKDILPCFNPDGLGAIVNSSRGVLYTHMSDEERQICTREAYLKSVKDAVINMQKDIYGTLKESFIQMKY